MNWQRIERQRDAIYRRTRARRIKTMLEAARWIDSVGFCLLFATTQPIELPSLFEAVKGRRNAHIDDWDADADLVWGWKNELPATRRAYYGKALTGKPIFIARAMLPYVLAIAAPTDLQTEYARGRISYEAKRVYDTLSSIGPTPTIALRQATGLDNVRYHRALDELQRLLVVMPVGATTEQSAWPSQIFDLVSRWFPHQFARAQTIHLDQAYRVIVRRYVETVVAAQPATLQRTLGLPSEPVNAALEVLIARRIFTKQGDWILRNVQ
jgi:hypothetical protein